MIYIDYNANMNNLLLQLDGCNDSDDDESFVVSETCLQSFCDTKVEVIDDLTAMDLVPANVCRQASKTTKPSWV
jgi:hypothetical protein